LLIGCLLSVLAVFFIDALPWRLPLLFMPCVACTYMPNASWRRRGGKAQGEGDHPLLKRKQS
jgi:hypothetical protein